MERVHRIIKNRVNVDRNSFIALAITSMVDAQINYYAHVLNIARSFPLRVILWIRFCLSNWKYFFSLMTFFDRRRKVRA